MNLEKTIWNDKRFILILAGILDCVSTGIILYTGGYEANPVYVFLGMNDLLGVIFIHIVMIWIILTIDVKFKERKRYSPILFDIFTFVWTLAAIWNIFMVILR